MKSRNKVILPIHAATAALALVTSAHAADYTWGGGTGNWSDGNWNPGPVGGPTAGSDTATINSGTVTLNVGGMNVGSLTLGTGGTFNAYNWNGTNTYTGYNNIVLQGGTLNGEGNYHNWGAGILRNVSVSGSSPSTISASSFFNLNGTGGNSTVFNVADVTGNASADLTVSATLADVSADQSWSAGALVKTGAGTLRLTNSNWYSGGTTVNQGTLVLDGGSGGVARIRDALTVNSGATVTFANDDGTGLGWNWNKVNSLTINGGTVSSTGVIHVWNLGGGINMTGGTLQSNNGTSDPNGPQLEWNYSSVTTHASADTATIGGRIRVRADGGYGGISFDVADGAAATDLLVSAAVTEASGGMGIAKSGAGTMVLSGSNNYTGATTVSAGTLLISGSLGNSAVSVATNATVGGSGTISGNLSFGVDSFFDIFTAVSGNDPLAVTGTVSFGGGFGIDNLTGVDWASVAAGTYTIIDSTQDFSSAGLDNWGSSNALPVAAGKAAYFESGSLKLVVVPEPGTALLGGIAVLMLFHRKRR